MDIPIFIVAGNKLINVNEILYISKAKIKNVYVVKFKQGVTSMVPSPHDNSIVFLSPEEYESFQKNLTEYYQSLKPSVKKQTKTKIQRTDSNPI